MDDFEAFRKKQKEKKASVKEAAGGEKAFDGAKEQHFLKYGEEL